MSIVLFHHPWSRAANAVWMLEEVGVSYELRFVDMLKGAQKNPEFLAHNPMGKLPTLLDGEVVVTEGAAIALYLADRYSYGKLAPKVEDAARATYLRWSLFAPSVMEPGFTAKHNGWQGKEGQVGWGSYDAMLASMEAAIAGRDFVLGSDFSMADVVFGGTVRYMLDFKLLDPKPTFVAYADRLRARDAWKRAEEKNKQSMAEHGLKMP